MSYSDDVTTHLKAKKKDQSNAEFKEFVVVKPEETKDTKTKDSEKTEDAKQTVELSDTQKEEQLSDINKMITDLNKIKGLNFVFILFYATIAQSAITCSKLKIETQEQDLTSFWCFYS